MWFWYTHFVIHGTMRCMHCAEIVGGDWNTYGNICVQWKWAFSNLTRFQTSLIETTKINSHPIHYFIHNQRNVIFFWGSLKLENICLWMRHKYLDVFSIRHIIKATQTWSKINNHLIIKWNMETVHFVFISYRMESGDCS